MHTRLLDVLHDRADHHLLAVTDGIDVDLDCLIEEMIEQHRRRIRYDERIAKVGETYRVIRNALRYQSRSTSAQINPPMRFFVRFAGRVR